MKVLAILFVLYVTANALPLGDEIKKAQAFNGTIWAVLIAGSSTWYNYGQQASAYHAYQVVRSHGIPDKNIIMMHYDDIANHKDNPTPGIVINELNGPDVYHDVPKDYTGEDVVPANFLGVLAGDPELKKNGRKVLESGPNDHVFVYFVDHGAPDMILFPHTYLHGANLHKTLAAMHDKKMFAKLVFYLETCYSGSMFKNYLKNDLNIYATTSSNSTTLSWMANYDPKLKTYIGVLYGTNWLADSEQNDLTKENLLEQFEFVRQETVQSFPSGSMPMEYGDFSFKNLPLSQFQGPKQTTKLVKNKQAKIVDAVNVRDVPAQILKNKIIDAQNDNDKLKLTAELNQLLSGRQYIDNQFKHFIESIAQLVENDVNSILNDNREIEVQHQSCYRKFVDNFNDNCLNINQNPYALSKLQVFANVCEVLHRNNAQTYVDEKIDSAIGILNHSCYNNKLFASNQLFL